MNGTRLELLTPSEMGEADRLTIEAGTPGYTLMQAAGDAVYHQLTAHYPDAKTVIVLVGPGNNGGDGYVVADLATREGLQVDVMSVTHPHGLTGDAHTAYRSWGGSVVPFSRDALAKADVLVDALFGAGLDRDVEGDAADWIDAANASGTPIIAVDLPSGIDGRTGQVRGAAIQAAVTVTFFRAKPGHVLYPGRSHCGEVCVEQIGIPDTVLDVIKPAMSLNDGSLWRPLFPEPGASGHKYNRGHALVVSGGRTSTGAARLTAMGALRAGAGLVTVASPTDAVLINAHHLTSIMLREVEDVDTLSETLRDARFTALVLGPGMGVNERTRDFVIAGLHSKAANVLDADALTSFVDHPKQLFQAIRTAPRETVLTPHGGEFQKLFRSGAPQDSKIDRARVAAEKSHGVVVFKGADTVIAHPDGRIAVNTDAPPWLATAGAGDVLAGIIAGLRAQGMPAFEAACAGVGLHGAAARRLGPGLIAEDLPAGLRPVLADLFIKERDTSCACD